MSSKEMSLDTRIFADTKNKQKETSMKQFKIEDIDSIASYVKSLDVCDQFEEINVEQITKEYEFNKRIVGAQISIKVLDEMVYDFNVLREFLEPIFKFTKHFEEEIRRLSGSALVISKLYALEESLNEARISNKDTYSFVTIDGNEKSYELKIIEGNDKRPLVKIGTNFATQSNLTQFEHRLETKEFVEISQIEQIIEEFHKFESISLN